MARTANYVLIQNTNVSVLPLSSCTVMLYTYTVCLFEFNLNLGTLNSLFDKSSRSKDPPNYNITNLDYDNLHLDCVNKTKEDSFVLLLELLS